MQRIIALVLICGSLAVAGASAAVAGSGWHGRPSNIAPLAFGMSADAAEVALGAPLVYIRGRRGNEIFIADRDARVPGLYPVQERYSLQFRRGRLTGWKRQWQLRRPFFF